MWDSKEKGATSRRLSKVIRVLQGFHFFGAGAFVAVEVIHACLGVSQHATRTTN